MCFILIYYVAVFHVCYRLDFFWLLLVQYTSCKAILVYASEIYAIYMCCVIQVTSKVTTHFDLEDLGRGEGSDFMLDRPVG